MAASGTKSSAGASKKSKQTASGDEPAPNVKAKKVKVPKQFIVRPLSSINAKDVCKVLLHGDILGEIDGLREGALVYLNKEGDLDGIVATVGSFGDAAEPNVILVSAALRNLASLLLGERLTLAKFSSQPQFCDSIQVNGQVDSKKLEKFLDNVGLVCPGLTLSTPDMETDTVTIIDVNGSMEQQFAGLSISGTEQDGTQPLYSPAFIYKKGTTKIEFTDVNSVSRERYQRIPRPVTYEAIGGLQKEISLLKTSVELPLHNAELFTQFGITPPRGLLLHGPPGTGKTMLLRAVANETNAHVLTINGPSIVSKYLGETENAIRDIFVEARKYQPSIVFLDEIDSLAPSRASDDAGEVESRVVATLLTLMDGMGDAGRLVVIGATNRPNAIDPALRRPGRFDQEIEIGIPDVGAREAILKVQFEKMKRHDLDEPEIRSIAEKTHGYVGADLIALCREGVMKRIQRSLADGVTSDLRISLGDMEQGLNEIRPSAMREIFLEMPKVYWTDIGGQEDLKEKLREMIQLPLEAAETFKKFGIRAPKGLLLYGPPGCSKTLTAKALATESGVNFLAVKGPEIFNKYVGESEKAIREIFRKARAASPSIIFFDEIDAISQDRSEDGGSSHTANQVLTTLLNEIDGVEELNGVVIVAATNRPDSIDAALLRPGRLDRHIYVAPPDYEARLQILHKTCAKFNLQQDVDLDHYAKITEGCSGAEITLLSQEAGLAAIMESQDAEHVHQRHFEHALAGLSRGITPEMLLYYKEFAARSGVSV